MNSGQTLMVIGAFLLLSTITLSVNATIITSTSLGLQMETTLDAISVGQSLLDEILSKEFDERTTGGQRAFTYGDITPVSGLGPDAGETLPGVDSSRTNSFQSTTVFDDVDDYQGYRRMAWNSMLGWFTVTAQVQYVNEDSPDAVSSTPTFYKCVTVTVTHQNLSRDGNDNIIPLQLGDVAVYRRYF